METNDDTPNSGVTSTEHSDNLELVLSTHKPVRLLLHHGIKVVAVDLQNVSLTVALHVEASQSIPLLEFRYPHVNDRNYNNCKIAIQDGVLIIKFEHPLAKYKEVIDLVKLPKEKILRVVETLTPIPQPGAENQQQGGGGDMAAMIQNMLGPVFAQFASNNATTSSSTGSGSSTKSAPQ